MLGCNDPVVTYLKSVRYLVVRLPKAQIRPLQLYEFRGKELERFGNLEDVFTTGNVPLPELSNDNPAPDISGQSTSDFRIGLGMTLLGDIIGAMGGSALELKSHYRTAQTITFEFREVFDDHIDPAQLDHYLSHADIKLGSPYSTKLLDANALAIITDTLKSRSLTVQAKDARGEEVRVDIPKIQSVIGGNIQVAGEQSVSHKITYQGTQPLVFGFRARRLFYDRGHYTAIEPLPPPINIKGLREPAQDGTVIVTTDSPFVQVHM